MKHQLPYCEIEQLSENVFEITPKEGTIVDRNNLDDLHCFWNKLRSKPFGLLVNCENQFSRSFEGSRDMGKHPLTKKIAFLCSEDDRHSKRQLDLTQQIKKMDGHFWNHKVFSDRNEAIEWLTPQQVMS